MSKKFYKPKLNPILHNLSKQKTEEEKRPNHPKFMTSSELAKIEWSGVRENKISGEYEFWILGEIKERVSGMAVAADPGILERKHRELFAL